jgi:hypothetical protein
MAGRGPASNSKRIQEARSGHANRRGSSTSSGPTEIAPNEEQGVRYRDNVYGASPARIRAAACCSQGIRARAARGQQDEKQYGIHEQQDDVRQVGALAWSHHTQSMLSYTPSPTGQQAITTASARLEGSRVPPLLVYYPRSAGMARAITSNSLLPCSARRADLPRDGLPGTQPLGQFRPPTSARDVAHRDGDGLSLADQYDEPLPTCDAGVEKVPLQHGVVLQHDRDDYSGYSEPWDL